MSGYIRHTQGTPGESGPDRRLTLTAHVSKADGEHIWEGDRKGESYAETQAFRPWRAGDEHFPWAQVTLELHIAGGSASVMLSPDEAAEIGTMLLVSASEAREIERAGA